MRIKINLSLPTSWEELSDKQLQMVFRLIASDFRSEEIKTVCLLRWNNIKVLGHSDKQYEFFMKVGKQMVLISVSSLFAAMQPLNFLDDIPPFPVRIGSIKGHKALPADFSDVPFETFLVADNLFQGYLHTQKVDILESLVRLLYGSDKIKPSKSDCIMAFYWFASLKAVFARRFHHFYQPIDSVNDGNLLGDSQSLHEKLMGAVNAQIRALTGGDVTKEPYIMQMDTIRALTELDAKAEDVERMNKKK